MTSPAKTTRIHCNRCGLLTNHILRGFYDHGGHYETESWDGYFGEKCHLYECAGCNAPTLFVVTTYSEDPGPSHEYWPPRNQETREAKRFHKLPEQLNKIYDETVDALNSGALVLCTIRMRTLLEGICNDKRLEGDKLLHKIEGLRKFFPSGNIVKYLHGFRFSGNKAAHQMEALTKFEAKHALDVMEDLLGYLYDLDYKASRLKHAKKRTKKKRAVPPAATAPPPATTP